MKAKTPISSTFPHILKLGLFRTNTRTDSARIAITDSKPYSKWKKTKETIAAHLIPGTELGFRRRKPSKCCYFLCQVSRSHYIQFSISRSHHKIAELGNLHKDNRINQRSIYISYFSTFLLRDPILSKEATFLLLLLNSLQLLHIFIFLK
jgi:hypothetical protein